jgi:SurA N-terminal domain
MTMHVLPIQSRRWHIIGGLGMVLVVLLIAGILIMRQRQLAAQASTLAGVCASTGNATLQIIPPPGVTLPVTLPAGAPRVVATVNGDLLYAEELEYRVEGTLANNRQALKDAQQAPSGSLPPNLLATLEKTPNQIRHDALMKMIQECLLLQEGKRLGLAASLPAAQAMARQQLQQVRSLPPSDPARVKFETYLQVNHLTEQTFLTDPRILHGYRDSLTIVAVRQHIQAGLPADELPESGISAYVQHLWQIGNVRVYLPAQLGW